MAPVGSLGAVFTLNILGGINTVVLVLGLVASMAALLFATMVRGKNVRGVTISILSFVIVLGPLGASLFIHPVLYGSLYRTPTQRATWA